MLGLYKTLMGNIDPCLDFVLEQRARKGKEDLERLDERKGIASISRPKGHLIWVHAASVGEAQSALILIRRLLQEKPKKHILLTTGTTSSATLMEKRLPKGAFHQFIPVDNPKWVKRFLDHWKPDVALWMESELWPNILMDVQKRKIPCALVNARLSDTSERNWSFAKNSVENILKTFSLILTQTANDARAYKKFNAENVHVSDNIKYSAQPLEAHEGALKDIYAKIGQRPCWLYASSHDAEELLAARVHERLKAKFPDLLTIIVPRHPARRDDIQDKLSILNLEILFRGEGHTLPENKTDIYIADTFGELGLFYRAAPIALIGRSFSSDGGGGHNPIEAAMLNSAVLFGPHVQNLQEIFDEMEGQKAAYMMRDDSHLAETLEYLLSNPQELKNRVETAASFARTKMGVLDTVFEHLDPFIQDALLNSGVNT